MQISKGSVTKDYKLAGFGLITGVVDGVGGELVSDIAGHAVQQAISRGVGPSAVLDALRQPLKVGEIVYDAVGRPSRRYVGRIAEVVINPETGKIVSVNPTHTRKAAKLLKLK